MEFSIDGFREFGITPGVIASPNSAAYKLVKY
jgi:hypothetical protein